jgi:hypothetical protein
MIPVVAATEGGKKQGIIGRIKQQMTITQKTLGMLFVLGVISSIISIVMLTRKRFCSALF